MGDSFPLPRRALSVEDYHRMGEMALFRPEERIELIEGGLISMAPIDGPHMRAVDVLNRVLSLAAGSSARISVQNPLSLPPDNEPQPDLMLLRPECWQRATVPTSSDVLLVVEVADTTLAYDRDVKLPLYARHGVPEVWLVDLQARSLRQYREPTPQGYRIMLDASATDTIAPNTLPQVAISLAELFG
jgi:Uma2 family endonuclease